MTEQQRGEQIRVRGLVQGVGFRPTVWRLAVACALDGEVWNDAEGVLIHAWGTEQSLDQFIDSLRREVPPLSRIDTIERAPLERQPVDAGFSIIPSRGGRVQTGVVPDAASCKACLQEVMDPDNRRYRYPFTNCTHCGPRLSIVHSIPYDRATTSMAPFIQCPVCQSEYDNPADRRFHAQPNACGNCGPRVWLEDTDGAEVKALAGEDVVAATARLLRQGEIVAIKGIGGIHLACDATNQKVVARLRQRKRRYHKAFALMARDLEMVRCFASVNGEEAGLLKSPAAPIVVLEGSGMRVADAVAPGQNTLGFMLPYTPLHQLIMQALEQPIVLTSGNSSDEPQVISNEGARQHLRQIADYLLLHDRDIVNRLDDSVVRLMDAVPRVLRRARGYAPAPLALPPGFDVAPQILAMGGELKNSFCLLRAGEAIISQHMGDLEDGSTHRDYRHNLGLYRQLFDHQPEIVAIDRHPDYLSSQWGRKLAGEQALKLETVQHHHAHIAACMAEQRLALDTPPLLGIALDGLGYGDEGALWGGEFLKVDYRESTRLAGFQPVAMIGGAKAMMEPWRNSYAYLVQLFGWEKIVADYGDLELIRYLQSKPVANLNQMLARGLNSPTASSCGRLFDGVAAAVGVCRESVSHEGQAAIELEALASAVNDEAVTGYRAERLIEEGRVQLSWQPLWQALLDDLQSGASAATISARFHNGLAATVASLAIDLCHEQQLETVVLSGGVFQNKRLLEGVSQRLRQSDLSVLSPGILPANDGGISLGQAVVAAARSLP
ncbi:MAG: carbamoyltransferase HypF [Candidatus Sedimenticola sp. (ex Thyasira tokunagai)]